jgi:general secretion pathway protein G
MDMRLLALSILLAMSGAAYGHSDLARLTAARCDLVSIKTAFDAFAIDCRCYPTTSEGFAALLGCPTNISSSRWRGPYLDRKPIDPWGDDYVYRYPGIHNTNSFDLYSCGADGISKSGGNDLDDINNWDPASPHGGNYPGLMDEKLRNSGVFIAVLLTSQIIMFLGLVRLIALFFSQRVRNSIVQHPILHLVRLVASLVGFLLFLSFMIPHIA